MAPQQGIVRLPDRFGQVQWRNLKSLSLKELQSRACLLQLLAAHHGRWVGQLLVGAIFIFFVTCLISDFHCNAATAKEVQQLAQAADRYRPEDIVECPQLQLQSATALPKQPTASSFS